MLLASILSGASVRRRLSSLATALALGAGLSLTAVAAAQAATVTYDFTASKFTRLSPLSSISGSFTVDYADGPNRLTSVLGPTATLAAVDLTIGGSHFTTANTALRFGAADRRLTLGGTAGGSLSVLDTDSADFILNFTLGSAIDNRPGGKTFVYSLAEGESYAAGKLTAGIPTPANARALLSRSNTFAAQSVVTPIPAPVLLFASAIGLGALLRRRQGARPSGEPRLG